MTTFDALAVLTKQASRIKYGYNEPAELATLIRELIKERATLQKRVAELEHKLNPPPPAVPDPSEGDGYWDQIESHL